MVVYRSYPVSHSCPPGGCNLCKENWSPPPTNPRDHEFCCQYSEDGQQVVVVIAEQLAPLILRPAKPRTKSRKPTRAPSNTKAVSKSTAAPKAKPAARKSSRRK